MDGQGDDNDQLNGFNDAAGNNNGQNNVGGGADEENVDQYFDDGGETYLPADHVCNCFLSMLCVFDRSLPCNFSIASHGSSSKCFDQTVD